MSRQLWLLRHGATEWALNGRHTGSTDLPLLPEGEAEARALGPVLSQQQFAAVFSSPLQRAQRTGARAGRGARVQICNDIIEWNYGDYEGITTATIRETVSDWTVWSHGCPNGEDAPQVEARCTTAISTALAVPGEGDVALFAHGHILRALAGTWLGLGATGGQLLKLGTASVSILGWERGTPTIQRWNAPSTGNF